MEREPTQPLELFYCYAREDHALRDKLDAHLATLHRTGLITAWYDGEIVPGTSWEEEIETHLDTADIILLLISPAFIVSDYCYSKEMKRALERHRTKEARVVPILLRPVDWAGTPFSTLQMLPSSARPVTRWPDRDEAFEDVAKGIRKVVNDLLSQRLIAPDSSATTQLPQVTPFPSSAGSQLLQRRNSRRTVLIGLAGLAAVGVAGGSIAWLTRFQGPRLSSAAATSTATVRSTRAAEASLYAQGVATHGVMVGFDAQHTHTNPYERILTPATVSNLKKKWVFQARGSPSSPVVAGGIVYIGSYDYSLYALDTASGHLKWAYQTGNIVNAPAVMEDTVYIGSADGKLYALDTTSGHLKWAYQTGDSIYGSSPTVADGVVYIGSADGKLYALDTTSGHLKWAYQTNRAITSSAAVADGAVYIGSTDGKLYALDTASGHLKWAYQTNRAIDFSSPAVVNGVVYIGSQDHNLYALDTASGHKKWAYQTSSYIDSSPAVADGVVYIGSVKDHSLHAVDSVSGSKRWVYQTGGDIEASPTVAGGVVYIGSRDYSLYGLEAVSGIEKWAYQAGNIIDSTPAVVDGVVYISSADHNLYAFDLFG